MERRQRTALYQLRRIAGAAVACTYGLPGDPPEGVVVGVLGHLHLGKSAPFTVVRLAPIAAVTLSQAAGLYYERDPRGLEDDGAPPVAPPRPPPLCTLTAWCVERPGHDGTCTTRPGDAYPPPDFGAAMATRRRA